jgi:hypothetical protein
MDRVMESKPNWGIVFFAYPNTPCETSEAGAAAVKA